MRRAGAYSFACPLALPEMLERLNALGRHEWIIGDSAWYGDYLTVWVYRGHADRVRLRIYEFEERDVPFVLEMRFESKAPDAETAWQALDAHIRREVFPALRAHGVAPIDTVD